MRSTRISIIILICLMLGIFVLGRMVKLSQEKAQIERSYIQQIEDIKKENENLKNENIILKKQVSKPIRDRVVAEIKQVFGFRANEAISIVSCENNPDNSNYNPYRVHTNKDGSEDHGVFQIHAATWVKVYGDKFKTDWKANIEIAKRIFDRSGDWRMWRASSSCHKLVAEGK